MYCKSSINSPEGLLVLWRLKDELNGANGLLERGAYNQLNEKLCGNVLQRLGFES